jgi:hypothetical protein
MTRLTISRSTAVAATLALLFLSACGEKPANDSPSTAMSPTAAPAPASAGDYKVTFRVEPDPPTGAKDNMVHVGIQDGSGKAVSDAQVHLTLTMPAMPEMKMAEMKNGADLTWNGTEYIATIPITMAGGWNVEVEAKRGGETLTKYETKLTAK